MVQHQFARMTPYSKLAVLAIEDGDFHIRIRYAHNKVYLLVELILFFLTQQDISILDRTWLETEPLSTSISLSLTVYSTLRRCCQTMLQYCRVF